MAWKERGRRALLESCLAMSVGSDAGAMAEFYGRLLGWEITYRDWDFIHMRDPQGGVGLSYQEYKDYCPPVWPEMPDGQDKMVHLDMSVDDLDAAVAHALCRGGAAG